MIDTPYFGWPYPEENDDPYFDEIAAFFVSQDDTVFGLMNTMANIIIPPSGVNWNPLSMTLTWNADFEIPLMATGFSLFVKYGPDQANRTAVLGDGGRLIVVVPRTSTGNVTANFSVVHGVVPIQTGLFTVGFCRGTHFYANFPQVF